MNKKLLTSLLAVSCLVGLAACGPKDEPLADTDHAAWVVAGENEVKDAEGNWVANSWGENDNNHLTATTVSAVTEISEAVGAKLAEKDLKCLYMGEVRLGVVESVTWKKCIMSDGKVWERNQGYAVKAIIEDYIEEDDVWSDYQWISDPKTAHLEALTPDTLFVPVWQEKADENGFSWSNDPVCIGKAGVYTIVVAQYKNASSADTPGYGMALILKEEAETNNEDKLYVAPTENTFGIVGTINNWGGSADVALTKVADGKYEGTITLAAGDKIKVRANSSWDNSWGFAALEANDAFVADTDGNIEVVTAGSYKVTLTVNADLSQGSIVIAAA